MQFEWDETKRLLNLDKHELDFLDRATSSSMVVQLLIVIEFHH